ncbi:lipopolysaccharide biosynthesis protein [Algivirga pacifica]|uniref:Membrane protein involved in the export of O-antigen and teichoic acid n=1 Tax=Algivirga pacifica TaxID=1162670 RepID=A0ABP9DEZ5_9BACT
MPSIKKIIWTLVNNLVDALISMGLLVLVTRTYSTENAGHWIVFITLFFMITRIREGMIQIAMFKLAAGKPDARKYEILKTNLLINMGVELMVMSVIYGIGMLNVFSSLTPFFLLYPVTLPWVLYRWQNYVHLMHHHVEKIFKVNVFVLIGLVAGMFAVVYGAYPMTHLLFILGGAGMLGTLVGFSQLNLSLLFRSSVLVEDVKAIFYYAFFGVMRSAIGTISQRIHVFFTAVLLSSTETAFTGVAQRYTQLLLMPNIAIQTLVFPKFCEAAEDGRLEEVKVLYEKTVSLLLSIFLPAVFVFILCASWLVPFINGEDYVLAIPFIIALLLVTSLSIPFGYAFGSVTNAIGKPYINTYVMLFTSSINVSLSYYAVSQWGLWGIVIGPLVAEFLTFFIYSYLLQKILGASTMRCFQLIPSQYAFMFQKVLALRHKASR